MAQLDQDVDVVQRSALKKTPTPAYTIPYSIPSEIHGKRQHGTVTRFCQMKKFLVMQPKKRGDLHYRLPSLPSGF
jgi:hypothetical protein